MNINTFNPHDVLIDEDHRYWGISHPGRIGGVNEILRAQGHIKDNPFWTVAGRDRGIRIHQACADVDHDVFEWSQVDLDVIEPALSYQEWAGRNKYKAVLVEKPLRSIHGYAGTLDTFGLIQVLDRYAVIDRKSGAASIVTALTTAGYKQLVHEALGIPLHLIDRYALQYVGSGRPRMVPYDDRNDLPVFLGLVAAFNWGINKGTLTFS